MKWEGTEGILEENNHMVTSCSLLKFHRLLHQMLSPTPAFVLFPSLNAYDLELYILKDRQGWVGVGRLAMSVLISLGLCNFYPMTSLFIC